MGLSSNKPAKINSPLELARLCLKNGRYVVTYHAKVRQIERVVPLPDVIVAIETGLHEKNRDRFDEHHNTWSYSIRGKSTNRRELRVVISFDDKTQLLIITVVVLKGKLL